jgi:hypothetical protein
MAFITAGDAIRAIDLQAYRMRQPDLTSGAFDDATFQRQADERFLIVALRWLHRACALAAKLADDAELHRIVDSSWQTMGFETAKDMRDVWEHFDDYIAGTGRLQKVGRWPEGAAAAGSLGVYVWTGVRPNLGSLSWAGLSLSLDMAVAVAHEMYAALRAVIAQRRRDGTSPVAAPPVSS